MNRPTRILTALTTAGLLTLTMPTVAHAGGDHCHPPTPPQPTKVTRTFQVDTYSNPTTKLANKAQRYDDNDSLSWREDIKHVGHSKWQIVKVTGTTDWTAADWRRAINKATTKAGVRKVNTSHHVGNVRKGQYLTVAWIIGPGDWPTVKGGTDQEFAFRGLSN